jgi:kynurenine formamidase
VLLDIPGLTGRRWLDPGETVGIADLERAEARADLKVGGGDVLLVRTGRLARKSVVPPWDEFRASAGLHPEVAAWLEDRHVALIGSDGANDVLPSPVPGVAMPLHVLCLVGLGMPLIDGADFEALASACSERGRWEFMFIVPTLAIQRATASPVTPIAVL